MIILLLFSSVGTQVPGPGEAWVCWVAVDYSKAYDCVSHPMMAALFRFIRIPDPRSEHCVKF